MKKMITLVVASIATISLTQAQNVLNESSVELGTTVNSPNKSLQEVVYEQPVINDQVYLTAFYEELDAGVYVADDFRLSANTVVTKVTAHGGQFLGNLEDYLVGLKFFIFEDNGEGLPNGRPDQPSSALVALDLGYPSDVITMEVNENFYSFTIDLSEALDTDLVLNGDVDYWVSVCPAIMLEDEGVTTLRRWGWSESTPVGSSSAIIDPEDLYEEGITEWYSFDFLGIEPEGFAFTVEGDSDMSVGEQQFSEISITPNPATTTIQLNNIERYTVLNTTLYDVLGKSMAIELTNGTVDIAHLPKGLYMLRIETTEGTTTRKVIKE